MVQRKADQLDSAVKGDVLPDIRCRSVALTRAFGEQLDRIDTLVGKALYQGAHLVGVVHLTGESGTRRGIFGEHGRVGVPVSSGDAAAKAEHPRPWAGAVYPVRAHAQDVLGGITDRVDGGDTVLPGNHRDAWADRAFRKHAAMRHRTPTVRHREADGNRSNRAAPDHRSRRDQVATQGFWQDVDHARHGQIPHF